MNFLILLLPLITSTLLANEHGEPAAAKEGEKPKAAVIKRVEIVNENESGYVTGPDVELERDVKIPKFLVEGVEKLYEKLHLNEHDAVEATEKLQNIPRQNLDLRVYFNERSSILKGGANLVVTPPTGGGWIDLSKLIKPQRGTFFWHVQLRPRLFEGTNAVTRVYFLSQHVRKHRNDGPAIGVGCNKILDLTTHFEKVLSRRPGEKLNTAFEAHLGTLLGTYYFFVIDREAVRVATLSFRDPRVKGVACEGTSH